MRIILKSIRSAGQLLKDKQSIYEAFWRTLHKVQGMSEGKDAHVDGESMCWVKHLGVMLTSCQSTSQ